MRWSRSTDSGCSVTPIVRQRRTACSRRAAARGNGDGTPCKTWSCRGAAAAVGRASSSRERKAAVLVERASISSSPSLAEDRCSMASLTVGEYGVRTYLRVFRSRGHRDDVAVTRSGRPRQFYEKAGAPYSGAHSLAESFLDKGKPQHRPVDEFEYSRGYMLGCICTRICGRSATARARQGGQASARRR
jgi:hypothetical protein